MKRFLIVLVLIAVPLLVWNCSSDIILEPEAPLQGEYYGQYKVIVNFNAADEDSMTERILWTFTEENYIMTIDTANDEGSCNFCRVDGVYAYSDGIRIQEQHSLPDGIAGCTACDASNNPEGRFRKETHGDTILLKQQEGETFKQLTLIRIPAGS